MKKLYDRNGKFSPNPVERAGKKSFNYLIKSKFFPNFAAKSIFGYDYFSEK